MFGFLKKGKITLTLKQYQYQQGQTIEGTVTVHMKKPVEAQELVVTLNGEETITTRSLNGESNSRTITICKEPLTKDQQASHQDKISLKNFP